jgi:hypothetical protein
MLYFKFNHPMKNTFATLLFLLLGMPAFAQLDSVQVNVSFDPQTIVDEVSDSTFQVQMLQAKIWVNDFDFLGQAMVSVYDQATHTPLARVKYTAAEITAQNLLADGWITLNLGALQGNVAVRVETQLTNFTGAYLAPVVTLFQNY